jgi:hypothetical protein
MILIIIMLICFAVICIEVVNAPVMPDDYDE